MASKTKRVETPQARAGALVAGAASELFERLGLKGGLGRIWAELYLSPDPLDATTLKSALGISSGSLSMGLRELMELGLVHRTTPPGERRFYYRAEAEMWSAITRVFRERERQRMLELVERMKEAEALLLEDADQGAEGEQIGSFAVERVRHLVSVGSFAIDLLDAFMDRTRVELKAAQKWLSMSGRLGGEPLSRLRRRINAVRKDKKRG
jgi:DNA-binding transcriptional regulator GbsR (MarR family)